MKNVRLLFILLSVFVVGCAGNPMKISSNQKLDQVGSNKSRVIFLRSSFMGSAINASLFNITKGEPEFIGIIGNGTRVVHDTQPGKCTFMVVSEAADYMEADLLPGKTYYALVTPRMGAWKARFSLWPIRNDSTSEYNVNSKDFKSWMANTKLVENSDESRRWATANMQSVKAKHAEYWPVWKQKTPEALVERTLKPSDGR
jgi:hypothetical protein